MSFTYEYVFRDPDKMLSTDDIVLLIKPDDKYNREISLKNLIFDITMSGDESTHTIVFEKKNPVTKEKLLEFINRIRKITPNIEFDSCLTEDIFPSYSEARKVFGSDEGYVDRVLEHMFQYDKINPRISKPYINDRSNPISHIVFAIFPEDDTSGLTIFISLVSDELEIEKDAVENYHFINFENLKY